MAISDIVLPVTFKSNPRGLKQAEAQLKNFGKNVGKIALGATAAVAGIAAGSVKAFADFDAALNQSLAIMGDVSDSMRDDMADAAREVAKTTTFSAEEAAESFFFLASAGLDAEQQLAALPAVANFAQAGMFDMSTATDLLTDAQSALGMSSDDAAENLENMIALSDMLVTANTSANATVEEFSQSLTNKAAVAMGNFGTEIEEGLGLLAVFADSGVKGERAGTLLSSTLVGLSKSAENNAAAFEEHSIAVFDAEGNTREMVDIVRDLEGATEGMSDKQRGALLTQLGFNELSREGISLLTGNSEALEDYTEKVNQSAGATDEVANKQLESFNAQLQLLQSALVDVGIEIGGDLVPLLVALVEDMKPLIEDATPALKDMFLSLIPVLMDLVKGFPDFVDALIPLIPIMGDIATIVAKAAVTLFPVFLDIVNALVPVFDALTSGINLSTGALAAIIGSIAGVIIVGTGIAKTIAIFNAFRTVIVGLRVFMVSSFLPTVANMVVGLAKLGFAFLKMIPKIVLNTALLIGQVTTFIVHKTATLAMAAATNLAALAQKAFNLALKANPIGLIITAVAALVAGLVWFFTQTELGRELWAQFVQFLTEATQAFVNFFVVLFTEQIPAVWAGMVEGLSTGWDAFKEYFFTALEAIGDFFKGIINGWISLFETFVNGMIAGVNKIINALNTVSIDIPEGVPKIGGLTFGINIPNVPEVSLPRLAKGGIVDSATIAMIGEAGPEAVIPLDKLDQGGSTYNITVNAGMGTNGPQVGEEIVAAIKRYERSSGRVFASA